MDNCDSDKLSAVEQLAVLLNIFSVLIHDKESKTLLPTTSGKDAVDANEREKIEKICDYLASHYASPLTLADLGKTFHCSGSSIQRLFSNHFGESFSSYLKKLRMGNACAELKSSHAPVALIAEKVGYRNLSNFNRLFKEYKCITPREFRARYQPKLGRK